MMFSNIGQPTRRGSLWTGERNKVVATTYHVLSHVGVVQCQARDCPKGTDHGRMPAGLIHNPKMDGECIRSACGSGERQRSLLVIESASDENVDPRGAPLMKKSCCSQTYLKAADFLIADCVGSRHCEMNAA